ncbi:predicted protein [Lichtheimia corymbifera JMRC:FSU:9682]|uniref:Uncharacterized protein n=1 Tax=Lichtheimia corymbifera JMRC:FSU:9682 TaxID=1263082 RepID=A0A068S606_9FUNG|nr:predicted protein [Lichtheimia corymbifera JMRC:FSU:9682]
MGFIGKLKTQYDLRKINKYTKRRLSQSQFASHDREYYNSVYRDGVYLDSDNHQGNKSRWSSTLTDLLKRNPSVTSTSLAASQYKTSETYTLGVTR